MVKRNKHIINANESRREQTIERWILQQEETNEAKKVKKVPFATMEHRVTAPASIAARIPRFRPSLRPRSSATIVMAGLPPDTTDGPWSPLGHPTVDGIIQSHRRGNVPFFDEVGRIDK
jgi:hypothetical protein